MRFQVCRFYHNEATFPSKIVDIPSESDPSGLMSIGNLLDEQLSVGHLARNDLVLVIADGPHGRNLIEYLYRERVFSAERTMEGKATGVFYVYPHREGSVEQHYIAHSRSWLPSGLHPSVRNKLLESVKTLDVVTMEDFMKNTSMLLMELTSQPFSSTELYSTLIESVVQDRAARVLLILDYRSARSDNLMDLMNSVIAVIESGQMNKLHLFVHFCEDMLGDDKVRDILRQFDDALRAAFKGRPYEHELHQLSFNPVSVPTEVRLTAHLLGASRRKLASFLTRIRSPNFTFDSPRGDADSSCDTGLGSSAQTAVAPMSDSFEAHTQSDHEVDEADNSMNNLREIMHKVAVDKVNISLDKLERDVCAFCLATIIFERHVREDRSKELTNIIASFQGRFQHVQNCIALVVLTASFFIHLLSFMQLDKPAVNEDGEPRAATSWWINALAQRYTLKQWFAFYVCFIVYYAVMWFVGTKFCYTEELDREKYSNHKTALHRLEAVQSRLKQLKSTRRHSDGSDDALPRRRVQVPSGRSE
ncbi:ABC transporter ATPase [Babesia ovata]|uniref:ABC transporter ATPase n=1 Tax=Babesia ovata TaxID=189622 RepID=A0A2H6KC13_9APIC|nr:ABC transporter ATPase [Babesia ovata]GBE60524.1 ABC transporter ATPase [Babesia ovata]